MTAVVLPFRRPNQPDQPDQPAAPVPMLPSSTSAAVLPLIRDGRRVGVRHITTLWVNDRAQTQWGWSCLCGCRYERYLPSKEAARGEAADHKERATGRRTSAVS